jgi:serine acetyltransferase
VVIRDVAAGMTVVGVPARELARAEDNEARRQAGGEVE